MKKIAILFLLSLFCALGTACATDPVLDEDVAELEACPADGGSAQLLPRANTCEGCQRCTYSNQPPPTGTYTCRPDTRCCDAGLQGTGALPEIEGVADLEQLLVKKPWPTWPQDLTGLPRPPGNALINTGNMACFCQSDTRACCEQPWGNTGTIIRRCYNTSACWLGDDPIALTGGAQ